ncbi:MAG: pirin family protein [Armatimonadetes bacterium]|nr:pirin family protein [Armatimonadota bacterium]
MSIRPVRSVSRAVPTIEGAGVHLHRAFGFGDTEAFDPFLLFDDFRNDLPEEFLAGFPWHPHRGIETVTYVLAGTVDHGDSMGNRGTISAGDVQWMTAGRGIVHQEMPQGDEHGRMHGFQLWANLPSSQKMSAPHYQEIKSEEIPEAVDDDGTRIRVVAGEYWGKRGPVDGIAAEPVYLDVSVAPGRRKTLPIDTRRQAFAYVFAGAASFRDASEAQPVPTDDIGEFGLTGHASVSSGGPDADNRSLVLFGSGDEVTFEAGDEGVRFLLVSGRPLREPVAWRGPIVMNTQAELQQAYRELHDGTFLRSGA